MRPAHLLPVLALALGTTAPLAAPGAADPGSAGQGPAAAALELALPLRCTPQADCWVPRYMDHDPGPGFRDYMCGGLGTDGHSGTDFAIRDLAVMARGVPVVAAAAGSVLGTRDGMADVDVQKLGREQVKGRECGNGVRLDHGDGWTTQYCHLRQGSVVVRKGDVVAVGQPLGLVGMSGDASFPHVHLSVAKNDARVDPFRGPGPGPACGPGPAPLWAAGLRDPLTYVPVQVTMLGFATAPPDRFRAREGAYAEPVLPRDAPALLLWLDAFGLATGDRLSWRIRGPDGAVVLETSQVEPAAESQNRAFRSLGRKAPPGGWPPGTYVGELEVERPGQLRSRHRREVELR
jgi:murein DD-endopeptidase MepM/ murein hydrolase activator NlpD